MELNKEKRVMVAFALTFVMLILYRVYFMKELPAPPKKATPAVTASAPATSAPPISAPAAPARPGHAKTAPAVALPVVQGTKAEDVVVENSKYRVTFSTEGGVVKSWVIKGYPRGELVDMVNGPGCAVLGYPMSVSVADPAVKAQLNKGVYLLDATNPASGSESARLPGPSFSPPVTLHFTYSDGKVQLKKEFAFSEGTGTYAVRVTASATDGQRNIPLSVVWPGGFGDQSVPPAISETTREAVYGSIGGLTRLPQRKMKGDVSVPGPLQLAGQEDKYFAAIFLPEAPDDVMFRLSRQEWTPPDWNEKEKPHPLLADLAQPQPKPLAFSLFVGPKDLDVLKSVKPPLDSLVDFGWFSVVAKPLFIGLNYIYDHWIHNYGWAIVILTLGINLCFLPLRLKSIRSAQEMQRVAPIIKGIQDKYKQYKFNDPRKQKMNEEVMKVYSEHHINPFGSCLLMLPQLPFLYGFYRVLDLSIELRHAPWVGWIKDLSVADPIYILPILMIVTTFVLQRMTPQASVDPSQQRMMMVMPIVMGVMFFRFPSGMLLYWVTGNVMQLAQQYLINRHMRPPDPLLAPVARQATSKG